MGTSHGLSCYSLTPESIAFSGILIFQLQMGGNSDEFLFLSLMKVDIFSMYRCGASLPFGLIHSYY